MKANIFFFWLGGWFTWGAIGGAVIGLVGSAVMNNQAKKARDGQQGLVDRLVYKPIDIEKIKADAAAAAAQNASASLELERSLQPDVAATRTNLSKSVSDQLKLGGRLPPDIANAVAQAARVAGGASGGFGGTPGATAATIGTTALGLINQRQGNANALLAANPLPVAGLDPGAVASLEIANNNAQNQFDLAKVGVQSNMINSNAQTNSAAIGAGTNALSGLVNLYARYNQQATQPTAQPAYQPPQQLPTFNSTIPSYNASLISN